MDRGITPPPFLFLLRAYLWGEAMRGSSSGRFEREGTQVDETDIHASPFFPAPHPPAWNALQDSSMDSGKKPHLLFPIKNVTLDFCKST